MSLKTKKIGSNFVREREEYLKQTKTKPADGFTGD